MKKLRVQFIHGLEGNPQGTKARFFAEHFEAHTPAMDTADFESCVHVQTEALAQFRPDVVVGSSFGGAVAVELLRRREWRGPTLLLAQAALRYDPEAALPQDVTVWLVHGLADEVIPPDDSRRLAKTGDAGHVRLLEVADDHPLHGSVAGGKLATWVRDIVEADAS